MPWGGWVGWGGWVKEWVGWEGGQTYRGAALEALKGGGQVALLGRGRAVLDRDLEGPRDMEAQAVGLLLDLGEAAGGGLCRWAWVKWMCLAWGGVGRWMGRVVGQGGGGEPHPPSFLSFSRQTYRLVLLLELLVFLVGVAAAAVDAFQVKLEGLAPKERGAEEGGHQQGPGA